MKSHLLTRLAIILTGLVFIFSVLAFQVPVGVKEQEVVANYRADRRNDGQFRPDGGNPWDYCIDSGDYAGCYYNPQPGDRINVGYWQGWRLTFWNIGEMGGEAKKVAKLEKITEFFTAGDVITEVLPPLTEDSLNSGITYSEIISQPADPADIMDLYIDPQFVFSLGFTGGPKGVFYEMDGQVQYPNGKAIHGDVMQGEDGQYYVQMSGAFNAKLVIDDPKVFDGFVDAPADQKVIFESEYAYGFSDYSGEVYVEAFDGEASMASEFDLSNPKTLRIGAGATIKTGSDSYAVIVLDSFGSRIVIGPNSEMKIKKPEYGFFDTVSGRALMKIKKNIESIIKDGTMEVIMNQAVAGKKGTTAVFIEEEGNSTVMVLEGEMYLRSNATGESKDILPGQMLSASPEGLAELSTFDIEAELAAWEQIVPKSQVDEIRALMAADQQPAGEQAAEPQIAELQPTDLPAESIFKPVYLLGIIPIAGLLLIFFIVFRKKKSSAPNSQ